MSHFHSVRDSDRHFAIDPATRSIKNHSDKIVLSQYDHDSERFTFEIPRYVEEHDMSLCDRIEVHYTNITRNKKQQCDDVYIVSDVSCDNDTVFFSWLISSSATSLIGFLKFSVTFLCHDEDGKTVYNWGTDIYTDVSVIERLCNTSVVIENNPDLFNGLKQEILDSIGDTGESVSRDEIEQIIREYLAENPPTGGAEVSDIQQVVDKYLDENPPISIDENMVSVEF